MGGGVGTMGRGRGKKGDQEKCMKREEVEGEEWGGRKEEKEERQSEGRIVNTQRSETQSHGAFRS